MTDWCWIRPIRLKNTLDLLSWSQQWGGGATYAQHDETANQPISIRLHNHNANRTRRFKNGRNWELMLDTSTEHNLERSNNLHQDQLSVSNKNIIIYDIWICTWLLCKSRTSSLVRPSKSQILWILGQTFRIHQWLMLHKYRKHMIIMRSENRIIRSHCDCVQIYWK